MARKRVFPMSPTPDLRDLPALDAYELAFQMLLGRGLSQDDRSAVSARYGGTTLDPVSVAAEILASPEFHLRHREAFARHLFPTASVVVSKGPMGHELFTDLRQFHVGFAMSQGHFEPNETAFVRRVVKPGMTVVDIGANIGYFTTMFAALVGDAGRVIAFEPVTDNHLKLVAALRRNGQDHITEVFKAAVSDVEGRCVVSYAPDSINMGGIAIVPEGRVAPHPIRETVPTVRLDDVAGDRRIDFIKIDIEGAEGLAFAGARHVLDDHRPTMMVEFNGAQLARISNMTSRDLFDRLVGHGYDAFRIGQGGATQPMSTADIDAVDPMDVINLAFFPRQGMR